VLGDVVFNITDYIEYHPGGFDRIMQAAGQNATKLFEKAHAYVNAKATLRPYILGKIRGGTNNFVDGGAAPGTAAAISTAATAAINTTNESSSDDNHEDKDGDCGKDDKYGAVRNTTDRNRYYSVSQLAYDAFENDTQRNALESIGESCTSLLKLFAKDFEENML